MEVEQRGDWHGPQGGAFFLAGAVPRVIGRAAGGAADVFLVVPSDLGLEQGIGGHIVGDFFVSQEGHQAVLERAEAAFDFAFGLGVGRDPVGDAQGGEGALELGMGVEAVGGRAVAEKGEAVGIEGGGRAVLFEGLTQMGKVAPSGVAGDEGAGDDFAGVIVGGEDEGGIGFSGPPGMR